MSYENKSNLSFSIVILILLFIYGFGLWSSVGLSYCFFLLYKFQQKLGNEIPIREIILLIAALQWVLGPIIEYHNPFSHYKYFMYVNENTYFSYVIPGLIMLHVGMFVFRSSILLPDLADKSKNLLSQLPILPYILVFVGLVAPFLNSITPAPFQFLLFFLVNLKYIGTIYLLFSTDRNRWLIFVFILGLAVISSIANGMFHDLILWGILILTFIAHELKFSFTQKTLVLFIGILSIMVIQSVKPLLRQRIWNGGFQANPITLFYELTMTQIQNGDIFNSSKDREMNVRLNQGWIISAIMENVPKKVPYANGETVITAVTASLMPRFLVPDKKMAGGRDNFIKYTGLRLGNGTSMSISLIGEGYANFGAIGGMMFLFMWGTFISWFLHKLNRSSDLFPTLLLWSPILFLQVVKAETELVVVLNYLIKASVFVFVMLWLIQKTWKIRV